VTLTSRIYKTYLDEVLNMYPSEPEVKMVKLPLVDPYNAQNGQYKAYLQTSAGANVGSPISFEATSLTKGATSFDMVVSPLTLTWVGVGGASVGRVLIKQVLPSTTEINCALIDFGESYLVDGDVVLDFTNVGFISFESSNYI